MILPHANPMIRRLAALAAGAVLPLAYAPYNLWFVAILSSVVLIGLWLNSTPRLAFVTGYLYGLGLFGVGTGWLHISINLFGGVNLVGAILLTFVFVMFLALFPAGAGYLVARLYLRSWPICSRVLLIPAIWTLAEWVRSWIFTGFPWLNLGYTQTDSPLSGIAPLTGVFGVSLVVMFTAAVLVCLPAAPVRKQAPMLLAVLVLWGTSLFSSSHDWTVPRAANISVALVQGAVPQQLKWTPEMRQPTLDRYFDLTEPYLGSDLIIWPEAAIPAFYHQIESYIARLMQLTRATDSYLLTGMPYQDPQTGKYLNSVVMLGDEVSFYFKRHLVPFGEYLPLDFILRDVVDYLGIPMSDFSAGDDTPPVLLTDTFAMGISICYEDTFGDEVIKALPEAAILVNVSNDAWFGDSLAPHQHLQMARMRALESGRYLLRATNTGITAIINEKGRVVADIPQFMPATLAGTARLFDGMTPYAHTGNYPVLGLIMLVVIAAMGLRRRDACNTAT